MIVRILDKKVEDFIQGLEKPTISKYLRMVNLLRSFGSQLKMPYSKKLSANLFELRIRGQQEIRIFYTFSDDKAILLHGFIKKTQQTPLREIVIAQTKLKALTAA